MGKGQQFEREFCKHFSLWYSGGERDDLFWRTSGSGARATIRARKGKQTENQAGDVMGTIPETANYLQEAIIELKCGYGNIKLSDLFAQSSLVNKWISKLEKETENWVLVHRNRKAFVIVSNSFLEKYIDIPSSNLVNVVSKFSYAKISDRGIASLNIEFHVFRYEDFFNNLKPKK